MPKRGGGGGGVGWGTSIFGGLVDVPQPHIAAFVSGGHYVGGGGGVPLQVGDAVPRHLDKNKQLSRFDQFIKTIHFNIICM